MIDPIFLRETDPADFTEDQIAEMNAYDDRIANASMLLTDYGRQLRASGFTDQEMQQVFRLVYAAVCVVRDDLEVASPEKNSVGLMILPSLRVLEETMRQEIRDA